MTCRKWLLVLALALTGGAVSFGGIAALLELLQRAGSEVHRPLHGWAPRVRKSNLGPLMKERTEIVAALEAHRESRGRYPESLTELSGYEPGWSDWRYEVRETGEAGIWIGDYGLHMFKIGWSSRRGWSYDA